MRPEVHLHPQLFAPLPEKVRGLQHEVYQRADGYPVTERKPRDMSRDSDRDGGCGLNRLGCYSGFHVGSYHLSRPIKSPLLAGLQVRHVAGSLFR
jgi:hypothetical protein